MNPLQQQQHQQNFFFDPQQQQQTPSSGGSSGSSDISWWNILYAAGVLLLSFAIAFFNKKVYSTDMTISYSNNQIAQMQHLVSEASRWHTIAQQDTNPAIALMHATYAAAYCNAARSLMDDSEIARSAGVHMPEMSMIVSSTQQSAFQTLTQMCPAAVPTDSDGYALYSGYVA